MKTIKYSCVYLLALPVCIYFGGCETSTQSATVNGRTVINESIGFDGYSVTVPEGYISVYDDYQWTEKVKERVESLKRVDKRNKDEGLANRDLFVVDSISFYNPQSDSAINFSCTEVVKNTRAFSQWDQNSLDQCKKFLLESHMDQEGFTQTGNVTDFNNNTGIMIEGIFREDSRKQVGAKAIVIGKYQEVFVIVGVKSGVDAGSIASDVRETAESIRL